MQLVPEMKIRCQKGVARVEEVSPDEIKLALDGGLYWKVHPKHLEVIEILEVPAAQPGPSKDEAAASFSLFSTTITGEVTMSASLLAWQLACARPALPDRVAVIGAGPIDHDVLLQILMWVGVNTTPPDKETDVLILGRADWNGQELRALLTARSGQTLKVLSQEMALAWLTTARDPFATDEAVLRTFGADHPGLDHLEQVLAFSWPTLDVPHSFIPLDGIEALDIGYLKWAGYRAGMGAPAASDRRMVLHTCYRVDALPLVFPQWYREQWGPPGSQARLRKIAESIAAFCKNQLKKRSPSEAAIEHWRSDLEWLKAQYYDGRYTFQWPSTNVW